MSDNSIYMVIDKKNVFIANKDYDITNNLIDLINNQIKIEPIIINGKWCEIDTLEDLKNAELLFN